MKTKEEAIADLLEEDRKYTRLMKKYQGDDEALGEADFLYQQGVGAADIELILSELNYTANN
jgi:hypothetical protein